MRSTQTGQAWALYAPSETHRRRFLGSFRELSKPAQRKLFEIMSRAVKGDASRYHVKRLSGMPGISELIVDGRHTARLYFTVVDGINVVLRVGPKNEMSEGRQQIRSLRDLKLGSITPNQLVGLGVKKSSRGNPYFTFVSFEELKQVVGATELSPADSVSVAGSTTPVTDAPKKPRKHERRQRIAGQSGDVAQGANGAAAFVCDPGSVDFSQRDSTVGKLRAQSPATHGSSSTPQCLAQRAADDMPRVKPRAERRVIEINPFDLTDANRGRLKRVEEAFANLAPFLVDDFVGRSVSKPVLNRLQRKHTEAVMDLGEAVIAQQLSPVIEAFPLDAIDAIRNRSDGPETVGDLYLTIGLAVQWHVSAGLSFRIPLLGKRLPVEIPNSHDRDALSMFARSVATRLQIAELVWKCQGLIGVEPGKSLDPVLKREILDAQMERSKQNPFGQSLTPAAGPRVDLTRRSIVADLS